MQYLVALDLIHWILIPTNYVEIGCRKGVSLALSQCPYIGIDPDFEICVASRSPARLFRQTSDDFFATENLTELLGGLSTWRLWMECTSRNSRFAMSSIWRCTPPPTLLSL